MKRLLGAVGVGITFALLQLVVFAVAQPPILMRPMVLMLLFSFLNLGSVWAVVGIIGGGIMPRLRSSIVAGALWLLAAVWCYYGTVWLFTPGMRLPLFPIAYWSLAAVLGGPFLGAAGALGRRRDRWSLVAWVGGPLLIVIETGREVLAGVDRGYIPLHIVAWILTAIGIGIAARRLRTAGRITAL